MIQMLYLLLLLLIFIVIVAVVFLAEVARKSRLTELVKYVLQHDIQPNETTALQHANKTLIESTDVSFEKKIDITSVLPVHSWCVSVYVLNGVV